MEILGYTDTEVLLWDYSEIEEYHVLVKPPARDVETLFRINKKYAYQWFGLNGRNNLRIVYYPFWQINFKDLTDPCDCPPEIPIIPIPPVVPKPPEVTSVTPNSGVVGIPVTIGGVHFTGVTSVTFGGVLASFLFVNDTTITATVPTGTGVIDVIVMTPDGISEITPADEFTYVEVLSCPDPGPGLATIVNADNACLLNADNNCITAKT